MPLALGGMWIAAPISRENFDDSKMVILCGGRLRLVDLEIDEWAGEVRARAAERPAMPAPMMAILRGGMGGEEEGVVSGWRDSAMALGSDSM